MQTNKKNAFWLPIGMFAVATFFYLYEFLLRVAPSVMRSQLELEFGLDATTYGVFASCYFWSYAPLQLPIGAWVDSYGPRRLLTFAIFLCAGSAMVSALTHSYFLAVLSRFFIGAGSAFAFIGCLKIISVWFDKRYFAILSGLTLTIGTMGATASAALSFLLNHYEWRFLFLVISILGLGLGVLAWLIIRDLNPECQEQQARSGQLGFWRSLKMVVTRPESWLVSLYAFLTTAPTDAFGGAWGVPYLVDAHHMDQNLASVAQAMTFVGIAIGSPILGWLSGYFNNIKTPMITASLLASLALSVLIYSPVMTAPLAMVLFFLFGATGTYVLAFVIIRHLSAFECVGTAVGFVNMISMIGTMLLIPFIGWMLDWVRTSAQLSMADYHVGLFVLPVFYLASALLIVPLIKNPKELKK